MNKALEGARKLCAYGGCMAPYKICGNPKGKSGFGSIRKAGKGDECPLAKYKVPFDSTPWWERHCSDPSEEELLAICDSCSYNNGDAEQTFYAYCIDCPVQSFREARDEAVAESSYN